MKSGAEYLLKKDKKNKPIPIEIEKDFYSAIFFNLNRVAGR